MPTQTDFEKEVGIPEGEQAQIDELNRIHSIPQRQSRTPVNVEDELLEEQQRAEELEAQKQQDRLEQLRLEEEQAKENGFGKQITEAGKNIVKNEIKTAAKEYVAESIVAATSEIWVPALGILAGVLLLFLLIVGSITVVKVGCDASYTDGAKMAALKLAIAYLPGDVCSVLAANSQVETPALPDTPVPTENQPLGSDASNRVILAQYGISVNKPNCATTTQTDCTSLDKIISSVLQEVISVVSLCDKSLGGRGTENRCGVIVTGGSEAGHAPGKCSHSNGFKMDLSASARLSEYIRNNFTNGGARGGSHGGERWLDPQSGAEFVLESNPTHWDIGFTC